MPAFWARAQMESANWSPERRSAMLQWSIMQVAYARTKMDLFIAGALAINGPER